MPIELFDAESTRSIMADWVEIRAFCTGERVSHADLSRSQSVREDPTNGRPELDDEVGEFLDAEILDSESERIVNDVWMELRHRQTTLGSSYPFALRTQGDGGWSLAVSESDPTVSLPRLAYLVCLLIAGFRRGVLAKPTSDWPKTLKSRYKWMKSGAADVFQAVSFLAAPALVGGMAHWFGWPRPDATPKLRAALTALVERLGHGKIKQEDPEWTTGYEKDGTVDIVIWRPFVDGQYAALTVFGQVASGENWRGKSVLTFIKGHFFDWFEDVPAEHFLPAMFMPFMLHDDAAASKKVTFAVSARGHARQDERNFGLVLDRLRIVELATIQTARVVEGSDEELRLIAKITRWLVVARLYAQTPLVTVTV